MYSSRTSLNRTAGLFEIAMKRHTTNVKNQFQNVVTKTAIDKLVSSLKVDTYTSDYKNASIVDMTGLPEIRAINNNLEIGDCFCLGIFNGKKINIRFFPQGGMETTDSPSMPPPSGGAGSPVTPEEERLGAIFDSFTPAEHELISKTAGFVGFLRGTVKGTWNLRQLNNIMAEFHYDVKAQLNRLGIDDSKPFTINGMTFALDERGRFITGEK